ncbi:uncharacterized protein BcabD6B2_50000 [Babesia caballi]|uniref:Uncharacterized protein n=1 Tax=Babesia caballi TaxID=5871 RepID=A0AAV4M107_BABCB|nr:hypothetical protein BcabD6B2_50000 [Babesia caballi]
MDFAVGHAHTYAPDHLSVLAEQVEQEVLDEELAVLGQRLAVQGVEHGVPGPVGGRGAPVRLSSLPELQRLPSERALVYFPVFCATEGEPVVFELDDGLRRLLAHEVNGILVAKPVGPLNGVVRVPPPVVFSHVSKRRVDAALRCHGVAPGGEQF